MMDTKQPAASPKATGGKIMVKQVKSSIRRIASQRLALKGLGLGRIGNERLLQDTPSIRGLIRIVGHLVEVKKSS